MVYEYAKQNAKEDVLPIQDSTAGWRRIDTGRQTQSVLCSDESVLCSDAMLSLCVWASL
jgi:hypothetical protein